MNPTRPRTLALIWVLSGAVTWSVLYAVYASLPPLTWTLVPALLIAAGAEAWTGRDLRARIQGRIAARPVAGLLAGLDQSGVRRSEVPLMIREGEP